MSPLNPHRPAHFRSLWRQPAALVICLVCGVLARVALAAPPAAAAGIVARDHWAYRPLHEPPVPELSTNAPPANPIDAFILAGLEARGFTPSPPADSRTLIRRVYFDLTGLPPTPEEVTAFVDDPAPDAYEKIVDRLLASPRY